MPLLIHVNRPAFEQMPPYAVRVIRGLALIPMKGLAWVMLFVTGARDFGDLNQSIREIIKHSGD